MVCECDICLSIIDEIDPLVNSKTISLVDCKKCLRGFNILVHERAYEAQFWVKCRFETDKWSHVSTTVTRIKSPPLGHRLRVKFLVDRCGDGTFKFFMSETRDCSKTSWLTEYEIATDRINQCMVVVLNAFNVCEELHSGVYAVNFMDTMSATDMLVSIYYLSNRHMADRLNIWEEAVRLEIMDVLKNKEDKLSGRLTVAFRQKGLIKAVSTDELHTDTSVEEKGLFNGMVLYNHEGSFSNPNGFVTRYVNKWISETLSKLLKESVGESKKAMLIELCSGSGNHTVGLCNHFEKCICVEIDSSLISKARINMKANGLDNVTLVNDDMNRLKFILKRYGWIDVKSNEFEGTKTQRPIVLLVDPPRNGLNEDMAIYLNEIPCNFLVYVACGGGLSRNFPQLELNFKLVNLCLADHFPFTHFLEKIAIFKRMT